MHRRTRKLSLLAAAAAAAVCLALAPLVADETPNTPASAAKEAAEKDCCASCCCCGHGEDGSVCARPHADGEAAGHHQAHDGSAGAGDAAKKKGCC